MKSSNLIAALLGVIAAVFFSTASFAACPSIMDYGGNNTGTATNDAAFTATLAASSPASPCVYFPSGVYDFASSAGISLSASSATASAVIMGDGADSSVLVFPNGSNGLSINLYSQTQSFHIKDLTIESNGVSNSTVGISAKQNQNPVSNPANSALNEITGVTVRGSDGYSATNRWGTAFNFDGVSNLNVINSSAIGSGGAYATSGTCLSFGTTVPAIIPVVANLIGDTFNYCYVGVKYGNEAQGVTISNTNMVGVGIGILVPSSETGLNQLSVANSQINSNVYGVLIQSPLPDTLIGGGNLFYIAGTGTAAILIQNSSDTVIEGNAIVGIGTNDNGIVFSSYFSFSSIITANMFRFSGGTCVWLQPGSQKVQVSGNRYEGSCAKVTNSGSNNIIGVVTQ